MRITDIYVFFTAILITYIKGVTPAQIVLERGSAMTRATFVIFWPKLSSFIDWCCCYTQVSYTGSQEPLVLYSDVSRQKENIHCWRIRKPKLHSMEFFIQFWCSYFFFELIGPRDCGSMSIDFDYLVWFRR